MYYWDGRYTRPDIINFPFHGFGEITFNKPEESDGLVYRGEGNFWDVDEIHPERTIVKTTQFRRSDDETNNIMTKGGEKDKSSLINGITKRW